MAKSFQKSALMKFSQAREMHVEEECNSLLFITENCSLQDRISDIALLNRDFYLPIQSPPTTRL